MEAFESVNYIVTSRHYAESLGCTSSLERIMKMRDKINHIKHTVLPMQDKKYAADPVHGFIENGQWIARCECGGCEFVDPDDGVFYCFSCLNRGYNHMLRHVVFPDAKTRHEIERLLLLRPVNDIRGQNDLERVGMAQAVLFVKIDENGVLPLTRSWDVGETVADLHKQQDAAIAAWKKAGN